MRRVCLVLLACAWSTPARAQDPTPASPEAPVEAAEQAAPAVAEDAEPPARDAPLRVGISPFAPFVFIDGEMPDGVAPTGATEPTESLPAGFSIDLWSRIARELGVEYRFVRAVGVADKLERLQRGELDVAVGGITLTHEREKMVDFTHPTLESGLGILVRSEDAEPPGLFDRIALGGGKWGIILGFMALVVISGHLMWWAERGRDAFNDKYIPGVFEGMYWAIVTASTVGYGDKAPARWPGRAVAALVIVISLPMFALFTAELASTITVAEIQSRIDGPEDLVNKRVGVVRGTSAASWATDRGLRIYQWQRVEEVYTALDRGEIDAVIHDAPNLQYYAQTGGRGAVEMVGGLSLPQNLGIAVRERSPLRERINRVLLELDENGELQRLRVEWFGSESTR